MRYTARANDEIGGWDIIVEDVREHPVVMTVWDWTLVARVLDWLGSPEEEPTETYQQRVIVEKRELDEKATKLSNFIGLSPTFEDIDAKEQERLREQCEIMWQYSEILGKRIAAFRSDSTGD